jgi:hypothetical protein
MKAYVSKVDSFPRTEQYAFNHWKFHLSSESAKFVFLAEKVTIQNASDAMVEKEAFYVNGNR